MNCQPRSGASSWRRNDGIPHMRMKPWALLVLAAGLLAGAGCSRQSKIDHHLRQGDRHCQSGQLDKAEAEYILVLREDPRNPRAVRNLGIIHCREERMESALTLLRQARELMPDDVEVRVKAARAAAALVGTREALSDLAHALRLAPGNEEAILLFADLTATNHLAEAARSLEEFRSRAQDRPAFHAALGALAGKAGDWPRAESEYQTALKLGAGAPALFGLATVCLARNDITNAAARFREMAALDPADSPRRMRYVDFMLRFSGPAEARKLLRETLALSPSHAGAWRFLAALAFADRDYAECKNALKNVLVRAPLNIEAILLQARLKTVQGHFADAVKDLEQAVSYYPNHPLLRYQLGLARVRNNELEKALADFDHALLMSPDLVEPVLAAAEVNLRRADYPQVVSSMQSLLKVHPGLWQASLLLADAHRHSGALVDAAQDCHQLAAAHPNDPGARTLAGSMLRSLGSAPEARKEFEKALELAPAHLDALMHLAELDVVAGQPEAAWQRVSAAARAFPQSLAHQLLLAELALDLKRLDQAESVLAKIIEANPGSTAAHALQARVYARANKHDQALAKLDAILAKDPANPSLLLQKGLLLAELDRHSAARDTYERLLRAAPANVAALNNLACLYSDYLKSPAKALRLAQQAREIEPRDPAVADTLGWILFKQGDYPFALGLLQESSRALPAVPEIHYHLAMAHLKMGETNQARAALDQALRSPKEFRGRPEAQRARDSIQ